MSRDSSIAAGIAGAFNSNVQQWRAENRFDQQQKVAAEAALARDQRMFGNQQALARFQSGLEQERFDANQATLNRFNQKAWAPESTTTPMPEGGRFTDGYYSQSGMAGTPGAEWGGVPQPVTTPAGWRRQEADAQARAAGALVDARQQDRIELQNMRQNRGDTHRPAGQGGTTTPKPPKQN